MSSAGPARHAANSSPNYRAAFNTVTRAASPLPAPTARLAATDLVADFIDVCDTAIDLAFDRPSLHADLLPGVDVDAPAAMLKAYLLFLASEGRQPDEVEPALFDGWYERVTARVWQLLGFERRAPAKLTVALAFSLLGDREHQAPELRALIWAVGDLAACNLMPGLRT